MVFLLTLSCSNNAAPVAGDATSGTEWDIPDTGDANTADTSTGVDTDTAPPEQIYGVPGDTAAFPDLSSWTPEPYSMVYGWGSESSCNYYEFGPFVSAGDFSGDGVDELVVGSVGRHEGSVFVYDVAAGNRHQGEYTTWLELTNSNGAQAGYMQRMGDVNGDGYDDLIVSAPYYDPEDMGNQNGALFVVFAPLPVGYADLVNTALARGAMIVGQGQEWGERLSLLTVGDMNNDGYADVLLQTGVATSGQRVFGYFGSPTPAWDIGAPHVVFERSDDDATHRFAAAIGDVTGDAVPDLVFTRENANTAAANAGDVIGYFGPIEARTYTTAEADFRRAFHVEDGQMGDEIGIGDLDGDGDGEIIVTGNEHELAMPDGTPIRAMPYGVLSGPMLAGYAEVDDEDFFATTTFDTSPDAFYAAMAYRSIVVDDMDGDGFSDLVMSGSAACSEHNGGSWNCLEAIGIDHGPVDGVFEPVIVSPNEAREEWHVTQFPMIVASGEWDGDMSHPELAASVLGMGYDANGNCHDAVFIF